MTDDPFIWTPELYKLLRILVDDPAPFGSIFVTSRVIAEPTKDEVKSD